MNGTMMGFPLTLVPILERAGRIFPKIEVVSRMPDRSLHRCTYGDVYGRARALAEALQKAGLKRGDRVATLMWNHYAHLEAYFGIPAAGGVTHTLNLRLHPSEIAFIVNHAEDRFLIVDETLLPLYEGFAPHVRLDRVIVVQSSDKPLPQECEGYEAFLASATGDFVYPALDENEAAAMCYTSGTTGSPKGVVYSHRALVLHSFAIALGDGFSVMHRDSVLPVVPMFHANAWGFPIVAPMVGAKLVFPGPHLDAPSVFDLIVRGGITYSCGVPTVWMALLEFLEKDPRRWEAMQGVRLGVGGAAMPAAVIRAFVTHGVPVCHGWGMTEITPVGSTSYLKSYMRDWPLDEQVAVWSRQGLPLPFVELRAVAEGHEVPWDGSTAGEVQVRGPWVAASYYKLPEESHRWTDDGWFCTGDVAAIDPEGYVRLTDRTKDMIKSGGEWISSVDLENAIMGHPAVKEAAVIAVPHPKWVERPLAVVVVKDGASLTPGELEAYLAERFAKWQIPDGFVFGDAIPRTSTGKFYKLALRERYRDWSHVPSSLHSDSAAD